MPYPLTTTLARIKAANPCPGGWARALAAAGKAEADEDLILFSEIINAVGIGDALWCCRAEPQHSREWRLFGVWCARQAQHLTTDQRSLDALDIAERYANGLATDKDLSAAENAARSAAWSAAEDAARSAAWSAARSAAQDAARSAAWSAAQDAAWSAARSAAQDAARSAAWSAARSAAEGAAQDAAWIAAWSAQRNAFVQLCTDGTLPTN